MNYLGCLSGGGLLFAISHTSYDVNGSFDAVNAIFDHARNVRSEK